MNKKSFLKLVSQDCDEDSSQRLNKISTNFEEAL